MALNINSLNTPALAEDAANHVGNLGGVQYTPYQPGLLQQTYIEQMRQNQQQQYAYDALKNQQLLATIHGSAEYNKQLLSNYGQLTKQIVSDKDAMNRTQVDVGQKYIAAAQQNQLGQQQLAQKTLNEAQQQQLGQQQLAQKTQNEQGVLANNEYKTAMDVVHQKTQDWMSLDKYSFQKATAGNAVIASSLNHYLQNNDIKGATDFLTKNLPALHQQNLITDEQYNEYKDQINDPLSVARSTAANVMIGGMLTEKNPATVNLMPPMGNIISGNFNMDKTTTSQAQQGIIGEQRSLADIGRTLNMFDPEVFTNVGNLGTNIANMKDRAPQWAQPIIDATANKVGVGTPEWRNAMLTATTNFKDMTIQNIQDTLNQQKGVRYNKMTISAIEDEIPDPEKDSAATAFTKTITLQRRMQTAMALSASDLKNGIDPNTDQEQARIAKIIKSVPPNGAVQVTVPSGKNQGQVYNWTWHDIENIAKQQNMAPKDFWQEIQPYAK